MKPGDIVYFNDHKLGYHRFWKILGIYLGAEGQEGLVEVEPLTERPGYANGKDHPTTLVPEPMLRWMTIYTPDIGG